MTEWDQASARLIAGLRQDILDRQIRSGIARLEAGAPILESFEPASPNAAPLIWRVAQWVDVASLNVSMVQRLLERMPRSLRSRLPLAEYAAVRSAEGMAAMACEEVDQAIAHFDAVLALECDIDDPEIVCIAGFWKARCQRKKGEYEDAFRHAVRARQLAREAGFERVAAVVGVLESWLLFQKGRRKDALKALREAEASLSSADDPVVSGNMQSTYGRIFRQEGRHDRAIHHFNNAIEEYRKLDRREMRLARTLANLAYVKRLVALELRYKIDADVARRKQPGRVADAAEPPQPNYRETFTRLRAEAFQHLEEAAVVCEVHPNHHIAGSVHLNRGLLHLDGGELDAAEQEGARAFALGEEKQDLILMARARILQCMVENAKLEEGVQEDPRHHAQSALYYIRDAIGFARATQNRRLLARVHTWHGLTLSNEFFHAHEEAIEAMNAARGYLDQGFHDTAWDDYQALRARVVKTHTIDQTLHAWSQGAVGDKTFKQISEQFAEILIPKVWELEGRKIARVANRLAISPKKVRRALARAGLLGHYSEAARGSPGAA